MIKIKTKIMPDSWQSTTLTELSDINPREALLKGTIASYVAMEKILPYTRKVTGFELKEFRGGTKFKNGDTLVARITPCLENGKTSLVDILANDEVGFGSTEFIVLREKKDKSTKKFLYYFAISPRFRDAAIKSMTGTSGRQRVQTDMIATKLFYFPLIPEQKAIANVLSSLDDKIELLRKQNETLEAIAQTIFKEWFVNFNFPDKNGKPYKDSGGKMIDSELGPIPHNWRVGKLGEEFEILMGQSPPGTSYNEESEGVVFFQGRTDFQERFPKVRLYTTEPKRVAEAMDVLVSVRAPVGDINVAAENCCIGRGLCAVRGKYKSYTLYKMKFLGNVLRRFEAEGTVFGSIGKDDFKNIEVCTPIEKLISSFEKIANPLDQKIFSNHQQIQTLSQLRGTLLPKLMSGQVRVG